MQNVYQTDSYIGSKQIANFEESCEALIEKFTLLEEFEAHNIELITNYPELLRAKNKATDLDQELYVLFFSFSDQENDLKWGDVIRYFFQRCKEIADLKKKQEDKKSVSKIFMAIDTDVVPGVMRKEGLNNGLRICLIIGGNYVNYDVYHDEYEKNKDKPVVICLERMIMNYEKNSMCQPLQLACPKSLRGGRCNNIDKEWYCSQCWEKIEYGFDENFYCKCGHQSIHSFGFKCDSKMHGIKFVQFDQDDLRKLLSKVQASQISMVN